MKNIINKLLSIFVTLLIALLAIGSYVDISDGCEDNTIMFLDEESSKYYSPPCVMSDGINNIDKLKVFATNNGFKIIRYGDVIEKINFKRDEDCFNQSGGLSTSHSIITELLLTVNLAPWHKSRWNEDGSWNW